MSWISLKARLECNQEGTRTFFQRFFSYKGIPLLAFYVLSSCKIFSNKEIVTSNRTTGVPVCNLVVLFANRIPSIQRHRDSSSSYHSHSGSRSRRQQKKSTIQCQSRTGNAATNVLTIHPLLIEIRDRGVAVHLTIG